MAASLGMWEESARPWRPASDREECSHGRTHQGERESWPEEEEDRKWKAICVGPARTRGYLVFVAMRGAWERATRPAEDSAGRTRHVRWKERSSVPWASRDDVSCGPMHRPVFPSYPSTQSYPLPPLFLSPSISPPPLCLLLLHFSFSPRRPLPPAGSRRRHGNRRRRPRLQPNPAGIHPFPSIPAIPGLRPCRNPLPPPPAPPCPASSASGGRRTSSSSVRVGPAQQRPARRPSHRPPQNCTTWASSSPAGPRAHGELPPAPLSCALLAQPDSARGCFFPVLRFCLFIRGLTVLQKTP